MKKTVLIILVTMSSVGFAMDADQLKDLALKACGTQLESIPEEMRAQSKKACECGVKNTDYAAVLEAQKTGNTEKLQQDAVAVAQKCAQEAM